MKTEYEERGGWNWLVTTSVLNLRLLLPDKKLGYVALTTGKSPYRITVGSLCHHDGGDLTKFWDSTLK
jgi:hypothetical protein